MEKTRKRKGKKLFGQAVEAFFTVEDMGSLPAELPFL